MAVGHVAISGLEYGSVVAQRPRGRWTARRVAAAVVAGALVATALVAAFKVPNLPQHPWFRPALTRPTVCTCAAWWGGDA